jgi:predicted transcriptional regulator
LEEQGIVTRGKEGQANVYSVTLSFSKARTWALDRLTSTYFGGSPVRTIAAILDRSAQDLTIDEIHALEALIAKAREKEGRQRP